VGTASLAEAAAGVELLVAVVGAVEVVAQQGVVEEQEGEVEDSAVVAQEIPTTTTIALMYRAEEEEGGSSKVEEEEEEEEGNSNSSQGVDVEQAEDRLVVAIREFLPRNPPLHRCKMATRERIVTRFPNRLASNSPKFSWPFAKTVNRIDWTFRPR
jgi:hypothetical protein